MEVGRVVSFDFLGLVDDYLDWNFLEILGDLDSETEECFVLPVELETYNQGKKKKKNASS